MVTVPSPRSPTEYQQWIICEQLVLVDFDAHCGPCPKSRDGKRAHVLYQPPIRFCVWCDRLIWDGDEDDICPANSGDKHVLEE